MWKSVLAKFGSQFKRGFSVGKQNNFKVAVLGAAGGVGQPLAMILKTNPLVTELGLYDISKATGIAVDLSHINTHCPVKGYCGADNLKYVLNCAEIVVIAAGKARQVGQKRSDLFKSNADIIVPIVQLIAKICPKALVAVITNPINSIVPVVAEVMKKANNYDPNRYFGITTLDVVRSRTFIANHIILEPQKVKIDVIGGHSGTTMLPVFSNAEPQKTISDIREEDVEKLTHRIQNGGKEVIEAKAGAGSATLSMSYASGVFINALLMGLNGMRNTPVECSFVVSNVISGLEYFATPLRFGKDGMAENLGLPTLNKYETNVLQCLIPELKKDIQLGLDYAKTLPSSK